MKLIKLFSLLGFFMFLLVGCKKSKDDNNDSLTVDANGNLAVSSDADGAVYAVKWRLYENNSSSSFDDFYSAYAWFGSTSGFKPAGTVEVNAQELTNLGGFNYYAYIGSATLFPTNTANWVVEGDAAAGVPGFSHTDNTAFANGGDFVLPSNININNSLTVNFSPINNVAAVLYTLQGNNGVKHKAVPNGASSVTFSSAEMKEVAYANDAIAVHITSVVYTTQTINGKKIYFVKQYQKSRETATQ